jgi:hypothetical protein
MASFGIGPAWENSGISTVAVSTISTLPDRMCSQCYIVL